MFKKLDEIGNITQANKSTAKFIRNGYIEMFPTLKDFIDEIVPKKSTLYSTKIKPENKIEVIFTENEIICAISDKMIIPSLRIIHKFPVGLPIMQVDKGAIKHVFTGANIMCPGLTSKGGKMDNVDAGKIVIINAEGKVNALAIGLTVMSTQQIKDTNKGIAIENLHYLNDGLWNFKIPKLPGSKDKDKDS